MFAGVLAALMAFAPGLTGVGDLARQAELELVAGNPPISKCLLVAAGYKRLCL